MYNGHMHILVIYIHIFIGSDFSIVMACFAHNNILHVINPRCACAQRGL